MGEGLRHWAIVFPGQGAQRDGMARDFVDEFAVARRTFDEASEALGLDLRQICHGEDERLHITEYTQPAILTAEIAMLRALREEHGLQAVRWGGHSLGEYTALVGAGAMPFASAVRLVRRRGHLMQNAVPEGQGTMIAVIQPDLDLERVRTVAREHEVDLASVNSPIEVVLSGAADALEAVASALGPWLDERGGRIARLNVSAPFHSRMLRHVEPAFREVLEAEQAELQAERARAVTSNFAGGFHDGTAEGLVTALTRHIGSTVRWKENMLALSGCGDEPILEIGPNRPLRKFFAEIGVKVTSIVDVRSASRAIAKLGP